MTAAATHDGNRQDCIRRRTRALWLVRLTRCRGDSGPPGQTDDVVDGAVTIGAIMALVVGAVVIVGAALVVVLRSARRRLSADAASMAAEVVGRGERLVRDPEPAVYGGGSGAFTRVQGNGTLVLTDRAVEFGKVTGPTVRVAREDIASVARQRWFRRAATGGRTHLVIRLKDGDEVGFFVQDVTAWAELLQAGPDSA